MIERRTLLRLLLLLASTAFSLIAVDVLFRAFESRYWIHSLPAESAVYDLAALDYNDHEGRLSALRGDDALRVLVIGDSFVESATLAPWSYASRLQALLGDASGRRVRVVNLGRNGTSFADYRSQLRHWTERVEFDAVLLGVYVGNDWSESTDMLWLEGARTAPGLIEDESALLYGPGVEIPHRYRLRFLDYLHALYWGRAYEVDAVTGDERYHPRSLQFPTEIYLPAQSRMVRFYRPTEMLEEMPGHVRLHDLLAEARALELAGKQVAVTVAPPHFLVDDAVAARALELAGVSAQDIDPGLPGALVAEMAREVGLAGPVLDLGPCLRAAAEEGLEPYWGTNTHWSVEGNQLVAEIIARAVAPAWLGVDAPPGSALLRDCAATPRPPTRDEREVVQRAGAQALDQRALEHDGPLAGLQHRRFLAPADLVAELEARGLKADRGHIRGAFWGHPREPHIQIERPHGLKRFVRPKGFATDDEAPGASLLIAFFHEGWLVGIGRTRHTLAESGVTVTGIDPDRPNVVFDSLIPRPRPRPRGPEELWVLAVSPEGRFSLLPPDEQGPDGVDLPWARQ